MKMKKILSICALVMVCVTINLAGSTPQFSKVQALREKQKGSWARAKEQLTKLWQGIKTPKIDITCASYLGDFLNSKILNLLEAMEKGAQQTVDGYVVSYDVRTPDNTISSPQLDLLCVLFQSINEGDQDIANLIKDYKLTAASFFADKTKELNKLLTRVKSEEISKDSQKREDLINKIANISPAVAWRVQSELCGSGVQVQGRVSPKIRSVLSKTEEVKSVGGAVPGTLMHLNNAIKVYGVQIEDWKKNLDSRMVSGEKKSGLEKSIKATQIKIADAYILYATSVVKRMGKIIKERADKLFKWTKLSPENMVEQVLSTGIFGEGAGHAFLRLKKGPAAWTKRGEYLTQERANLKKIGEKISNQVQAVVDAMQVDSSGKIWNMASTERKNNLNGSIEELNRALQLLADNAKTYNREVLLTAHVDRAKAAKFVAETYNQLIIETNKFVKDLSQLLTKTDDMQGERPRSIPAAIPAALPIP